MSNTIKTPTWTIELPAGWHELKDQDSGMHFESADGEQALFIATWTMAPGAARSARALADDFLAYDLRELAAMEGHTWTTLEQGVDCGAAHCTATVDSVEEEEAYRIISRILTREGQAVRATFHDYACEDLDASRALFAPMLASLAFICAA